MKKYVLGVGLALVIALLPGYSALAEMLGIVPATEEATESQQAAQSDLVNSSTAKTSQPTEAESTGAKPTNQTSKQPTATTTKKESTPSPSNADKATEPSSSRATASTKRATVTKVDTSSKPTDKSSNSGYQVASIEEEVFRLVNVERQKRGLKPLQLSTKISSVAERKSDDMKTRNYFDHQSPTYGSPFDMLRQFGVSYRTAGENIAAGQRTAAEVMNSWMNSSGHRANILNPNFTQIGIGYVQGGTYGTYWTQMFIGN